MIFIAEALCIQPAYTVRMMPDWYKVGTKLVLDWYQTGTRLVPD